MSFMKTLKNEKGLTLSELLAALTLTTLIGFIAYGILFNGYKTYDRVNVEAALRDEADLIMAELLNQLFLLKESEIDRTYFPQPNSTNYFIQLTNGQKIGFIDGKVFLDNDSQYIIQNNNIRITDETKIQEVEKGQYRIILSLEWIETNQTLTTESEIGIIKDNG